MRLNPSHNDHTKSIMVIRLSTPMAMNRKLSGTKFMPINPKESKADVNMNLFLLLINHFNLLKFYRLFPEEYPNS